MDITKTIHKALSDSDIRGILGYKSQITTYSELSNYNSLSELLPELVDYVVILYEEHLNSGHWVGLIKDNNMCEFFDPNGLMWNKELLGANLKTRQMLHEQTAYLANLLKNERSMYNHVKYQIEDTYINTCGSHAAHRMYRLILIICFWVITKKLWRV